MQDLIEILVQSHGGINIAIKLISSTRITLEIVDRCSFKVQATSKFSTSNWIQFVAIEFLTFLFSSKDVRVKLSNVNK